MGVSQYIGPMGVGLWAPGGMPVLFDCGVRVECLLGQRSSGRLVLVGMCLDKESHSLGKLWLDFVVNLGVD